MLLYSAIPQKGERVVSGGRVALAVEEAAGSVSHPGPADGGACLLGAYREEVLNLDKLEAQLKACHCRLVFSKAKVSTSSLLWFLRSLWFVFC